MYGLGSGRRRALGELNGEGGCAWGGGRRSTLVWKVALRGRVRSRDQHRAMGDRRRFGGQGMLNSDRGDSVRLLRQDDPVFVVVGGDQLLAVITGHPVAVGWEARS